MRQQTGRSILRSVARTGRAIVWLPGDVVAGRRDPMTPPRRLGFVGPGDFDAVGREVTAAVIDLAGLRPDDDVLDLGSGNGRIAVPLTKYLSSTGTYHGVDVARNGIRWCNRAIGSRFGNFTFTHVDTHHPLYNPRGTTASTAARLPFDDASFDVVIMSSVFTHLLPGEAASTLDEVARVLRPTGVLFSTWFALDDVGHVPADADFTFEVVDDDHAVGRPDLPHARVAHRRGWIRDEMARVGLTAVDPIHDGRWAGAGGGPHYQDAVIARFAPADRPAG